jgi:hypothetical protein
MQGYQKFYMISPSAEISRWNRLMTSPVEFWKSELKKLKKKTRRQDTVIESGNMKLYSYVHKCSCRQRYVVLTAWFL